MDVMKSAVCSSINGVRAAGAASSAYLESFVRWELQMTSPRVKGPPVLRANAVGTGEDGKVRRQRFCHPQLHCGTDQTPLGDPVSKVIHLRTEETCQNC